MSERDRPYTNQMTEAQMIKSLGDYVKSQNGVWFHVRNARGQNLTGLPDFLAVLPPRAHHAPGQFVAFELKTQGDRISPEQRHTMFLLERATEILSGVVRPVPGKSSIEMSLDDALELMGYQPDTP